ncbi:hypothetical protein CNR22_04000 [Sphingobacteriaceae bacterium]|nr:hypothetical protein CNR22_04000 [Sphingobacteriaceae bacterium]
MATFLGIYSRTKQLNDAAIQPILDDFKLNNTRDIVTSRFPGMLLCVASKFQNALYANDTSLSFVSGHISFETISFATAGTTAEKFGQCIAHSGCELLSAMEGAFAALHYTAATHTLILANDKFGIFPLFISENEEYVIVSNEYQPLVQLLTAKERKPDPDAIAEFFTLGTTLGGKTFYKTIKNIAAASFITIGGKTCTDKNYWHPMPKPVNTADASLVAEELFELFKKINREYIDANVTDLCLLSAGADSRLIFATLTKEQRQATEFYTSNLSFLDPQEDQDVVGATALVNTFGLKHRIEKISFYENQFNLSYFDTERALRARHVYGGWHGGELLGGFAFIAAPIKAGLGYKDVNHILMSVFSWRFRFKLKAHPYHTYLKEKEKYPLAVREFLFITEQFTRSFFTTIYGGTKGHWLQPYQLANHGFSPFWDSRLLQKLMLLPIELLANYQLYNSLFKLCDKAFTSIPSNSPLTNRADSVIPKLEIGIEPKGLLPDTHHAAYMERLEDKTTWKRHVYTSEFKKKLSQGSGALATRWLDFETWYARYVKD